ncbi:hypothetical protein HC723_16110 [Vibrio sp. S11_S32]|uniref:hypothetical protein n=1 Tax=Vibrio sp. S11_S32 TaxID=2720225 RepID=UPI001681A97E|nr:hypothetical protein [Vibrio sp. S11_S32]MBD1577920.1 hypothetical protein [Vibrio sp. S11_S32]
MKFSCGITLYYPDENQIRNVERYSEMFDSVYVIDNTPVTSIFDADKQKRNVFLLSNSGNIGLSKALNIMCKESMNNNYKFICLLDQDSHFELRSIDVIKSFVESKHDKSIGIFSPRIIYEHDQKNKSNALFELVPWVITSGSFINLSAFEKVGGFDDNYFIDRIEYDYCHQLKKNNYVIIQINEAILNQSLGCIKHTNKIKIYQHSPIRNYYQFRNRIYFYIHKSECNFIKVAYKICAGSIVHILKVILLEDEKKNKIKYIIRAIVDSFKGKYGKYKED